MVKQKVIFRADGNSTIGLGHVSRCLALAELLSKNFDISFALQEPDDYLLSTIKKVTSHVISLQPRYSTDPGFTTELKSYLTGNEIVVLDGYSFSTEYEKFVRSAAGAVVCIDDIPNRHFVSDIIINFCGEIASKHYSHENYTRLLLGLDYLFLRSPFLRGPYGKKDFSNRLFLNMGGADPTNEALKILSTLQEINYKGEIELVVGHHYAHTRSLEFILQKNDSIILNQGLNAEEMYRCMNKCSMAILPPSTVALEFLSTGGLVFLHQTTDNQVLLKNYLVHKKLAYHYSSFNEHILNNSFKAFFQEVMDRQKNIFDGSSLARVQEIFKAQNLQRVLSLRKVTVEDMHQCFEWANDPEVRKYSYSAAPIVWDSHVEWFTKKMADANCHYFIGEIKNSCVGQIRFDLSDEEIGVFMISYAIDKNWRGKGLGYRFLAKGVEQLVKLSSVKKIVGYVQEMNIASIKAFQKAGFKTVHTIRYPNSLKFELSL